MSANDNTKAKKANASTSPLDEARALFAESDANTETAAPRTGGKVVTASPLALETIERNQREEAAQMAAAERASAALDGLAVGHTGGDAEDNASTVENIDNTDPRDVRVVCPNCGARWPFSRTMAGSTIPCAVCAYHIGVPTAAGASK